MLDPGESIGIEPPELAEQVVGLLAALVMLSPAWLIFVFAAFAIGRRRLALRDLFIFIAIEAMALGLAMYI